MTLQEMREAVLAKGAENESVVFRLCRRPSGEWFAGWSGCRAGHGATAQQAIDAAFKLAMEDM